MENFLPIRREIMNHWTYDDPEVFKLWVTLLFEARYIKAPGKVNYRGKIYELAYGEVLFGRDSWAQRLKMTPGKIRHTMDMFRKDGMIGISDKSDNRLTIVQILNYSKYNSDDFENTPIYDHENRQVNSLEAVVLEENDNHQIRQQDAGRKPGERRVKAEQEERKEIKTSISPEQVRLTPKRLKQMSREYSKDFEEFWELYPKKVGKKVAYESWLKRLKDGEFPDDMKKAVLNYCEFCRTNYSDPVKYMKDPSRFIGDEKWYCDYIDGVPGAGAQQQARRSVSKYVDD